MSGLAAIGTFLAVLVALFGERLWKHIDKIANRERAKATAKAIIKPNLEQLRSDLIRIRDQRNVGNKNDEASWIIFDSTSFSEVNGYYFLFSDVMLPNMELLEMSRFSNAIEFFNHYKINMETIRQRLEEPYAQKGLTLGTVNKLMERLEKTIKELS